MRVIRIYTDGAHYDPRNSGPASRASFSRTSAIGIVIWKPDDTIEECGVRCPRPWTSDYTELQAAYAALACCDVSDADFGFLYTDSLTTVMALDGSTPIRRNLGKEKIRIIEHCRQLMHDKFIGVQHVPRSRTLFTSRANHLANCAMKNTDPIPIDEYEDSFRAGVRSTPGRMLNDLGVVLDKPSKNRWQWRKSKEEC